MKKQDETVKIKENVETELLKVLGVNGIDVGAMPSEGTKSDEMVIRIYVSSINKLPQELANVREIQGVRVVFIERHFELH